MKTPTASKLISLALFGVLLGLMTGAVYAAQTILISKGVRSDVTAVGHTPRISDNGRYVVYVSYDSSIVPDSVGWYRLYLYDRQSKVTEVVDVPHDGSLPTADQGDPGFYADVSDDGRLVAFSSRADNLVFGDTNGLEDVFVRDRETQETKLISAGWDGLPADGESHDPSITPDGRFVVFQSLASNLTENDDNGMGDYFVYDVLHEAIQRIPAYQNDWGTMPADISDDGRFVAFESLSDFLPEDTNGQSDIFVFDRVTAQTELVSLSSEGDHANGYSAYTSISSDGRFVAFLSFASNLVPNDTNGKADIFVRDRHLGITERVSTSADGGQIFHHSHRSQISGDGQFVVFENMSPDLVLNDTNGATDIFVKNIHSGEIRRVNLTPSGEQSDMNPARGQGAESPTISRDGSVIGFVSGAEDLIAGDPIWPQRIDSAAFIFDAQAGVIEAASRRHDPFQSNQNSQGPMMRPDGRLIAYSSVASNLVLDDDSRGQDVFVFDPDLGLTTRLSPTSDGLDTYRWSELSHITGDDSLTRLVIHSDAENWVQGDANNQPDVFVLSHPSGDIQRASETPDGIGGNGASLFGVVSRDGRYVAFQTLATNFGPGDLNAGYDVFLKDFETGEIKLISKTPAGTTGNDRSSAPTISADGRFIAFSSRADDLVPGDTNASTDVFLFDQMDGSILRLTRLDGGEFNAGSGIPQITAEGRFIYFNSYATNIVPNAQTGALNIFRYDRQTGEFLLVSETLEGRGSNVTSMLGDVSQTGRYVTFYSYADDLVPGDSNGYGDTFVRDMETRTTRIVSVGADGAHADGPSIYASAVDETGTLVAFQSEASNLAQTPDTNGLIDIYLRRFDTLDRDNDGVPDVSDNCPDTENPDQSNFDGDLDGDTCDSDDDNDGISDIDDNCPRAVNPDQADADLDGAGDYCDSDDDGDLVQDNEDQCPSTSLGDVVDALGCSVSDRCPCSHPDGSSLWTNHGAYVRCVVGATNQFRALGLITEPDQGELISSAGSASCGLVERN